MTPLINCLSMMARTKMLEFLGRSQEKSSKESLSSSKALIGTCSLDFNLIQFCLLAASKRCSVTCPMVWEASTSVLLHSYVKLTKETVAQAIINVLVASSVAQEIVQPCWSLQKAQAVVMNPGGSHAQTLSIWVKRLWYLPITLATMRKINIVNG